MHILGRFQIEYLMKLRAEVTLDPSHQGISSSHAHVVCELAEDLLKGSTRYIAGIVNLGGVHWITVLIDGPQKRIWIGDSLIDHHLGRCLNAPKYAGVISTLQWWIQRSSEHIGLAYTGFECDSLKINPKWIQAPVGCSHITLWRMPCRLADAFAACTVNCWSLASTCDSDS